jgi:predicted DNA-binding transcriptional regulator YafY
MGQRTPTETLFGIVTAFIEQRTWTQAALARRLETRTETIRTRLEELQAGGFKLQREEDRPHVYWSVPKDWFPGALVFKEDEAADLLRLIARAPRSKLRDKVIDLVAARLANVGQATPDVSAIGPTTMTHEEEDALSIVEDAARQRVPLKMRYFSASRRSESKRHASVHRVEVGARPHFIATCHRTGELRRFRVSNVLDAKLDPGEAFRDVAPEDLARFESESLAGFRSPGPKIKSAFFVRDPEAAWVAKNLPDEAIREEAAPGGARFAVETSALMVLARFVAGLGGAATPETPELAKAVRAIAEGALGNASGAKKPRAKPRIKLRR